MPGSFWALEFFSYAERIEWDQVDEENAKARDMAKESPWLRSNVEALERYAKRRERARFSKEAMYGSSRLNARLAGRAEAFASYGPRLEASKPA